MAATSCSQSLAGVVLPFAATPMYNRLGGVPWASSLLGFLSLAMRVIPWVFRWQGQRLRDGGRFCTFLKEKRLLSSRSWRGRGVQGNML
ncbi:hypothetical protein BKA64DRAFT_678205 [Cadophora sp. MPI-SDFR-AT-0126]|nr:hypothetical protein BKA64DRAFT_678205 [Leotiomycetes sp. MPI-SDFR-AT-0126]